MWMSSLDFSLFCGFVYVATALCVLDIQSSSQTWHVPKQTSDLSPHLFFLSPPLSLNEVPSFHLLGPQSLGSTFCSQPTSNSSASSVSSTFKMFSEWQLLTSPGSATWSKPLSSLPRLLQWLPLCSLSRDPLKPESDPSILLVKAWH